MELQEIIGYVASVIIAISMLMTSIVRLRWLLLAGNIVFIVYGLMINSYPVALLNTFNAVVNAVQLYKIYHKKDYFKLLQVRSNNLYLAYFMEFYKKEINIFFPDFKFDPEQNTVSIFILRNMMPAGVFLAKKVGDDTLQMSMDFVIPEYRDLKPGWFLYVRKSCFFKELGYKKIITRSPGGKHESYLKKMGFEKMDRTDGDFLIKCL